MRERGPSLAIRYRAKDPELQRKIEELAGIREAYRHQRRMWLWMMAISLLSSAMLFRRSGSLALLLAMLCLAVGLFLVWNYVKCSRVIRTIDKGLAPHRVEESKVQK
jgi:hypothetical protein